MEIVIEDGSGEGLGAGKSILKGDIQTAGIAAGVQSRQSNDKAQPTSGTSFIEQHAVVRRNAIYFNPGFDRKGIGCAEVQGRIIRNDKPGIAIEFDAASDLPGDELRSAKHLARRIWTGRVASGPLARIPA